MLPTLLALLVGAGCAPEAPVSAEPCARCTLSDDNQYAYEALLDAEVIEVAPGADAEVDWHSVSRDLQGHTVATADISEALLIGFLDLSPAEVAAELAADTLRQDSIAVWLTATSSSGHAKFSDFSLMGNHLDAQKYVQPGVTWLVAVREPGSARIASMVFVTANAAAERRESRTTGGPRAEVVLDNESSVLDVDVDFVSAEQVWVASNEPALVLDWSDVSADGLGNPLSFPTVTDLFLGRFSQSRSELQAGVFDLEMTAEESWTMRLGGSSWANLSSLQGKTPFTGVSDDETWVMLLACSQCLNPAPRLVAFLSGTER